MLNRLKSVFANNPLSCIGIVLVAAAAVTLSVVCLVLVGGEVDVAARATAFVAVLYSAGTLVLRLRDGMESVLIIPTRHRVGKDDWVAVKVYNSGKTSINVEEVKLSATGTPLPDTLLLAEGNTTLLAPNEFAIFYITTEYRQVANKSAYVKVKLHNGNRYSLTGEKVFNALMGLSWQKLHEKD